MLSYSVSNSDQIIIHVEDEPDLFFKHSERDRVFACVK